MATMRLMPLHTGKGRTVGQGIRLFSQSGYRFALLSTFLPRYLARKRNILLDIIRNENIINLDNNLRSDGIVWSWRRL